MRALQLVRTAAEAEVLLIRRETTIAIRRAAYGAAAGVFGLGALTLLHILAYIELVQLPWASRAIAVAIVLGFDVVVAGVLALMASGTITDPVAEEARALRDQCLAQAKRSLSAAAVLAPAGRLLGRKHIYGLVLAALTARFLGSKS